MSEQQREALWGEYQNWRRDQGSEAMSFEMYLVVELIATRGLLKTSEQRVAKARQALIGL